jgi:hypothetical protein
VAAVGEEEDDEEEEVPAAVDAAAPKDIFPTFPEPDDEDAAATDAPRASEPAGAVTDEEEKGCGETNEEEDGTYLVAPLSLNTPRLPRSLLVAFCKNWKRQGQAEVVGKDWRKN